MSLLSKCSRLSKKIDRRKAKMDSFNLAIKTLKKWNKEDQASLNLLIKCLPRKDYLEFGYKEGFIDEADYQTMTLEVENEKNKSK